VCVCVYKVLQFTKAYISNRTVDLSKFTFNKKKYILSKVIT